MCENEQKPKLELETWKKRAGATLMKTKSSRVGAGVMFMKRRAPKLELCHFYDCSAALKYPHW